MWVYSGIITAIQTRYPQNYHSSPIYNYLFNLHENINIFLRTSELALRAIAYGLHVGCLGIPGII